MPTLTDGQLYLTASEVMRLFDKGTLKDAQKALSKDGHGDGLYSWDELRFALNARVRKDERHKTMSVTVHLTAGTIERIVEASRELHLGFEETMRDLILAGLSLRERQIEDAQQERYGL